MRSGKIRGIVTALVVSMLFSTMTNVSYAKTLETPIEAVRQLTEENRSIIKKVQAEGAFVIDPAILSEQGENVRIIVELKESSVAEVINGKDNSRSSDKEKKMKEQKEKIDKQQKEFKEKINESFKEKNIKPIEVSGEYYYTFNGVAMEIPKSEINTLIEISEVKRVWKDGIVQAPQPQVLEVADGSDEQSLPASLPHIGVDKLHGEGITGEGVKVAVLDTGIDYNHPDLKDAYKGGYDFVDDDSDPMETTYQDWLESGEWEVKQGSYYYTSHGTHVAGTIAANPKNEVEYAMTGVAPDVDLYMYRVLGPYGFGHDSTIIAAIEYSVQQGMDVINLSLGSSFNNSLSPSSIAINNVAKLGVVPCVAAGNAGQAIGSIGSPGTAPLAITVGASTVPTNVPTTDITLGQANVEGKLFASNFGEDEALIANNSYPIVDLGFGYEYNFYENDVNGKIALVQRGWLKLYTIIKNAKDAGAAGLLIYNDVEGEIPYFFGEDANFIPTFTLTKEEGEALISELNVDPSVTIHFDDLKENIEPGDYLSDFSSRGPVLDNFDIKPDVVAPGENILSTYPEYINSKEEGIDYTNAYYASSGTSMATPHVAGVAALILQKNPEYATEDVKAALANTANPLAQDYNVLEVGAGRVDAYEAVHTDNLIQVMDKVSSLNDKGKPVTIDNITSSLRFGSIPESEKDEAISLEMQVTNFSNEIENFQVSVEFLNIENNSGSSLNAIENGVTLEIPDKVEVAPNSATTLNATIKIPTSATQGVYQGNVYFTNTADSQEVFKVPFAVRHTESGFEYVVTDKLALSNDYNSTNPQQNSYMSAMFRINSPMDRIDIVLSELEGNPVGYIAQFDAKGAPYDVDYFLFAFFKGYYYPIISKREIGSPSLLPEGEYKISFIGTDENGNTYEVANPLIIDNTKPEITFNENEYPGIYEVSEDDFTVETDNEGNEYEAIWFHGNLYDSTVERLVELGYETDVFGNPIGQNLNTVTLYKDDQYAEEAIYANANGDFKFSIKSDEIAEQPLNTEMYFNDYATAGNSDPEQIFVVREGEPYGVISYDKDSVKLGETIVASISVENTNEFVKGRFEVGVREQYEYTVNLSENFLNTVEAAGGTAKLEKISSYFSTAYEVTVEGASLNGDLDVLEIHAKVISDDYWDGKDSFVDTNSFSYKNSQGDTIYLRNYSKDFDFISQSSKLMLDLSVGEAIKNNYAIDFTEYEIRAWLVDKAGNTYEPTKVLRYGLAYFENVPAVEDMYTLYVDMPGHFLYSTPISLSKKNLNGESVGVFEILYPDTIAAGDVNKDGKINILDKNQILKAYGEGGTSVVEDLNQDGIVDDLDLSYVIKNYLLRNPYGIKNKDIKNK